MAAVLSDPQGRIVSWGWNIGGSRPLHAEIHALSRANPRRVLGSTLYLVGRRAKSGNWVQAFPCRKKCLVFVRTRGVRQIVWLNKEGAWKTTRLPHD